MLEDELHVFVKMCDAKNEIIYIVDIQETVSYKMFTIYFSLKVYV